MRPDNLLTAVLNDFRELTELETKIGNKEKKEQLAEIWKRIGICLMVVAMISFMVMITMYSIRNRERDGQSPVTVTVTEFNTE